ncbi:hypothetical protein FRX31_030584 [Thalictrum thalictroides]|uniref:Uncharacterized protein n=1 Tax=Thalictrum thalictroides TaxID=46969 RepID=A0A7J6V440_THATH|nr:hypothetical protein FRX31_030584 [Thalictrum thalictroides]
MRPSGESQVQCSPISILDFKQSSFTCGMELGPYWADSPRGPTAQGPVLGAGCGERLIGPIL